MARPNKKALAKRASTTTASHGVTLRERLASSSLQRIEVPFLVLAPEKLESFRGNIEELIPEAITALKGLLTPGKTERNAGSKVQAIRTVFEVLNILKPSPGFAATLVHEKTRETTTDRHGLAVELLRGMDPDERQAIVDAASEPPPPDTAPPLDFIDVTAEDGTTDAEATDPFEDPFG